MASALELLNKVAARGSTSPPVDLINKVAAGQPATPNVEPVIDMPPLGSGRIPTALKRSPVDLINQVATNQYPDVSRQAEQYETDNDFFDRLTQRLQAGALNLGNAVSGVNVASKVEASREFQTAMAGLDKQLAQYQTAREQAPDHLKPKYDRTIERLAMRRQGLSFGKRLRENGLYQSLQAIAGRQKELAQIPRNPAVVEAFRTGDLKRFWHYAKQDPLALVATVALESLPASAPSIGAGALTGTVTGALTGGTGAPTGFAAGTGAVSGMTEFGLSIVEGLRKFGADVTDPASMKRVMADHSDQVRDYATKRAVAVGAFDFLDGKIAATAGKTMLGKVGKNALAQPLTGMAGEASGQVLSTGKVEDKASVAAEGIAEFAFMPGEVAAAAVSTRRKPEMPLKAGIESTESRSGISATPTPEDGGSATSESYTSADGVPERNVTMRRVKGGIEPVAVETPSQFVERAISDPSAGNLSYRVRTIGGAEKAKLEQDVGVGLPNIKRHTFDQSQALKIMRDHGPDSGDQNPLFPQDFDLIETVLTEYDNVIHDMRTTRGRNLPALVYRKRFNGNIVIVEEIHDGAGNLSLHTMYKTGGGRRPVARESLEGASRFTSETLNRRASPNIGQERAQDNAVPGMPTRRIQTASGRHMNWRGPMDLVTWLRTQGGVREFAELQALGIDNKARTDMGTGNENFIGRLLHTRGMSLDEAALKAWEAGYFPEFSERPTPNDLLDAIAETHSGLSRRFTQDDHRVFLDLERQNVDLDEQAAFFGVDIRGLDRGQAAQAVETEQARQSDLLQEIDEGDLDAYAPLQGNINSDAGLRALSVVNEGRQAPTGTGNIDVSRLGSVEDIRGVLATAMREVDPAATRGKQSNAATIALAKSLGLSARKLASRQQGQAFNAEQAVAARTLLAESAEQLVRFARQARGGSEADLLTFQEAFTRHVAIQEQIMGITAEAGRALQSFKITARTEAAQLAAVTEAVQSLGGRTRIEDLAEAVSNIDDPAALNKFTRQTHKVRMRDKIYEAWINGLLSSPKTHAANFVSNVIIAALQVPESFAGAALSAVNRSDERIYFRESSARAFGLLQAAKSGAVLAAKAFHSENPSDPGLKLETDKYRAIEGTKGRVARIPGRLLMASDEFFKAINKQAELNALAYRDGIRLGKTGDALAAHVESILIDPPRNMEAAAKKAAQYRTFTQPLGRAGQNAMTLRNRSMVLKVMLPFIRTPVNIVKFAAERSAFGLLMSDVRADLSGRNGKAAQNDAAAKMILGSTLSLWAVGMALEGDITGGGPDDWRQRQRLMSAGWQPYSIKIGDTFYSYRRIEPFNLLFGIAADMVELTHSLDRVDKSRHNLLERIGAKLTFGVAQNITSTTWMSGISDAIEAINSPEHKGARFLQRLAGSALPTVSSHIARDGIPGIYEGDPVIRESRDFLDELRSRTPIISKDLQGRYDIWGEPIIREGGAGPDILSPINIRTDKNDPVKEEAVRLGIGPSPVNRRVMGVTLTSAERAEYQRIAGKLGYEAFATVMASEDYHKAGTTDGERIDMLRRALRKSRRQATMIMKKANNGAILKRQLKAKQDGISRDRMKPNPALR